MSVKVVQGDAIERLRELPAESVHCTVTSVPYFGLRSYLDGEHPDKPLEIGSEATPAEWCARLVEVFREVRRVLRPDGLLWVNCGSTYASGEIGRHDRGLTSDPRCGPNEKWQTVPRRHAKLDKTGYKPGDLMILPVMLAEALRQDGWWLRDSIIWAKDSCMPESVRGWRWEKHRVKPNGEWVECPGCPKCLANDGLVLRKGSWRHTSSYEYVFMLAKSPDYFADGEAVKEPASESVLARASYNIGGTKWPAERNDADRLGIRSFAEYAHGRNPRNVWKVGPESLSGIEVDGEVLSHYAAFPRALVRKCLLASVSAKGYCSACGAPWARILERGQSLRGGTRDRGGRSDGFTTPAGGQKEWDAHIPATTLGWLPTCQCDAEPGPATILDPFAGSGTVGLVADEMGQDAVLIELSEKYVKLAQARLGRARARRALGEVDRVAPLPGQMDLGL